MHCTLTSLRVKTSASMFTMLSLVAIWNALEQPGMPGLPCDR